MTEIEKKEIAEIVKGMSVEEQLIVVRNIQAEIMIDELTRRYKAMSAMNTSNTSIREIAGGKIDAANAY